MEAGLESKGEVADPKPRVRSYPNKSETHRSEPLRFENVHSSAEKLRNLKKRSMRNPPRWRIALARMRLARADYVGDRETDDNVGPLCLPSHRAPLNVQDVEQVVWVPRSHLIQTATH